jgi:hypothetical protein
VLGFPLDDCRGSFAGETSGVKQIVVLEHPYCASPLQGGKRSFDRAAQRIVKGEQSRRLTGPEDEM